MILRVLDWRVQFKKRLEREKSEILVYNWGGRSKAFNMSNQILQIVKSLLGKRPNHSVLSLNTRDSLNEF